MKDDEKMRELKRQLQASFREVLRLNREIIKLEMADGKGKQAVVPRPESRQKRLK